MRAKKTIFGVLAVLSMLTLIFISASADSGKPPIKLTVYQLNSFLTPGIQTDPVAKEIERITGITLDIMNPDEQKFKVMLASGDLPDLVMPQNGNDLQSYMKQLIEGNHIIPLDDLIKTNGQDLLKANPTRVDYSRKFMSNNRNKVYFLPIHAGLPTNRYKYQLGFNIRWDYYKELGYPKAKSPDDVLKILAAMQKKHPTTDDGRKTYGISSWNDWGLWPFVTVINSGRGIGAGGSTATDSQYNVKPFIHTDNGIFWESMSFFNKAYRMGVLDPECFTQKYEGFYQKLRNLQLLSTPATWWDNDVSTALAAKGILGGYGLLPDVLPYQYRDDYSKVVGWSDKLWSISKNCKYPERAMDLLNFLFSYDGSRLIACGIKGKDWDIENGRPEMSDRVIKERSTVKDFMDISGINKYDSFRGLHDGVIHPIDKGPINLFNTPKVFKTQLTPVDIEYSKHYGASYPGEVVDNLVKAGKLKYGGSDLTAAAALPAPDDDIKRIDAKVDDYLMKALPKIILTKSDAEFKKQKKQMIADLKAMGIEKSFAFWAKAYKEAVKIAAPYVK